MLDDCWCARRNRELKTVAKEMRSRSHPEVLHHYHWLRAKPSFVVRYLHDQKSSDRPCGKGLRRARRPRVAKRVEEVAAEAAASAINGSKVGESIVQPNITSLLLLHGCDV